MTPYSSAQRKALDVCVAKTRTNIARLADAPKSAAFAVDGNFFDFQEGFFEIGNWTSSFFTGLALQSYELTRDRHFLEQCERLAKAYEDKVTVPAHAMNTMHDLGFLYSLYSVALHKITGSQAHRAVGIRAAEELAKRYIPEGRYLRAWGRMDEHGTEYDGLAIIDCLMNLPLLFWAAKETGQRRFHDIAVAHADTTIANFIRPDDSVFHAFRFDLKTGKPLRGDNYCGRDIPSHWARGTTWGIYGLALAYGYTADARYLEGSRRLASKFISLLDAEGVPVWDFKLPAGESPIRDSSAAAVAVCGFLELLKHDPKNEPLAKTARLLLDKLCSDAYLDSNPACPGILRKGQVGDGVGKAKNAYMSWGDYYFMEALLKQDPAFRAYW